MKETGNISKSQYTGTKKNSICSVCNQPVNHLNRVQQDKHLEVCLKKKEEQKKQKTLFD